MNWWGIGCLSSLSSGYWRHFRRLSPTLHWGVCCSHGGEAQTQVVRSTTKASAVGSSGALAPKHPRGITEVPTQSLQGCREPTISNNFISANKVIPGLALQFYSIGASFGWWLRSCVRHLLFPPALQSPSPQVGNWNAALGQRKRLLGGQIQKGGSCWWRWRSGGWPRDHAWRERTILIKTATAPSSFFSFRALSKVVQKDGWSWCSIQTWVYCCKRLGKAMPLWKRLFRSEAKEHFVVGWWEWVVWFIGTKQSFMGSVDWRYWVCLLVAPWKMICIGSLG